MYIYVYDSIEVTCAYCVRAARARTGTASISTPTCVCVCVFMWININASVFMYESMYVFTYIRLNRGHKRVSCEGYGVATSSRLLQIIGLFCRI